MDCISKPSTLIVTTTVYFDRSDDRYANSMDIGIYCFYRKAFDTKRWTLQQIEDPKKLIEFVVRNHNIKCDLIFG